MKVLWGAGSVVVLSLVSTVAHAQANVQADPRNFEALSVLPSNTFLALGWYRQVSSTDSESYSGSVGILGAFYTVRLGNFTVVPVNVGQPVADLSVYVPTPGGGTATVHASGLMDTIYVPTVSYTIEEDKDSLTHTFIAFSPTVTAPTGSYDPSKLVNTGEHRWLVQPTIAVGQRLLKAVTLELVGDLTFYTDNEKFVVPTGVAAAPIANLTMKQDMTWGLEAHVAVDLSPTFFVAGSYYLSGNGKETIEAPKPVTTSEQTIQTLRLTYGVHVDKTTQLLLQYNQDLEASGGASIGRFFGARLAHAF